MSDHLAAGRHPAGEGEHQPAYRVDIGLTLVFAQHRTQPGLEILHRQAGIEVERAVGALDHHRPAHLVVFVGDVADDLLDQILDRHQPVDAAVFVHHQRQMHMRLAHLQQQVEHRDLRRHQQRAAEDTLQLELVGAADIGEHVLDVDHARHVIEFLAIHRQP